MKFAFLLFLTLLSRSLLSDDQQKVLAGFDPRTDDISEKYDAGPYLIYDCEEGHWVCVTERYYLECDKKRSEDLESPIVRARCAPIGALPTKKSCFQRQLFMTSNNYGDRSCILPRWKEKELLFR